MVRPAITASDATTTDRLSSRTIGMQGAVVFGPGSGGGRRSSGRKNITETKQTPSIAAEGYLTAGRLRQINMSRGARSGWRGPSQGPASANP